MVTAVYRLAVVVCSLVVCWAAPARQNSCSSLRSYGEDSEVVFTGTILRLDQKEGRAEVRIKRILKGSKDIHADSTVRVEGVTNTPCHGDPKLRTRDSRIFMVERLQSGSSFRLNGTLLRITVPNLERVSAVVKGEPYHRRPPIIDLPCELKYCPWGADCVEARGGNARCQCPETCPVGYSPVCGSNGATYVNECRLRRESCTKKSKIFLKHTGPCPTATSG